MTFKTKAQIFGDNAGNGLQVPISTSNPPGTAAPNRGIGFGEGVTSAIANRTTAALAENDEDLNARIATFEAGGLDSAYRGGAAAVPGIGREITVDGGAVELIGDAANNDAISALLRSTMRATGDDIGLDLVGAGTGVLHRSPQAFSGSTVLPSTSIAAVLNPAGAGTTIVEIAGLNRFATSGATELAPGQDLLIVTGAGAYSGVYWISAILTDYRVQVAGFLAPVAFPATTAAQVRVERVVLQEQEGSVFLRPDASSTGIEVLRPAAGIGSFLKAQRLDTAGSPVTLFEVDPIGAVRQTWDNNGLSSLEARTLNRAARFIDVDSTATDGRPVLLDVKQYPAYDYSVAPPTVLSLQYANITMNHVVVPGVSEYHAPATVSLVAGTNKVSVPAPNNIHWLFRAMSLVRISGTSGGQFDGVYAISEIDLGTNEITLLTLTGTAPSPLFTAQSATLDFLLNMHAESGVAVLPAGDFQIASSTQNGAIYAAATSRQYHFTQYHYGSGALFLGDVVVAAYGSQTDASNKHGIRPVFDVDTVAGIVRMQELHVRDLPSGGHITANGHIDAEDYIATNSHMAATYIQLAGTNGVQMTGAATRVLRAAGLPVGTGWSPLINQAEAFNTSTTGSYIYFDFALPNDFAVTSAVAVVTPGAARATLTDRIAMNVYAGGVDNTGASIFELFPGGTVRDDGSASSQNLTVAISGGTATTGTMVRVQVRAGLTAGTDLLSRVYLLGHSTAYK